MALIIVSILLIAFAILGFIDGFYLHIWKFELFNHKESWFEHLTHTLRALLFPLIVFFMFIMHHCVISFYIGSALVLLDILILIIDAYSEKDSRVYMGGLPRWEYIIHLLVNGFHFASIAVFLSIRLDVSDGTIVRHEFIDKMSGYNFFHLVSVNVIPGAILLALLHLVTLVDKTKNYWLKLIGRINCCK